MKYHFLFPCLILATGIASCKREDVPPPPGAPASEKSVSLDPPPAPAETTPAKPLDPEAPKEGLPKPVQEDFKAATPDRSSAPDAEFEVQTKSTDDATRQALDKLLEKAPTGVPAKP